MPKIRAYDEDGNVTYDEAVRLLPSGVKTVHTFRAAGPVLLGVDMRRSQVLAALKRHGGRLTGPRMRALKHGLAVVDADGPIFLATPNIEQLAEAPPEDKV